MQIAAAEKMKRKTKVMVAAELLLKLAMSTHESLYILLLEW